MSRIPLLPRWVLPSVTSVFDLESATPSEMVSRLYGVIKNLVEDYNKLVDEINAEIKGYSTTSSAEIEEIRRSVEQRLICKFNEMDQKFAAIRVELMKHATEYIAENVQGVLPVASTADNGKFLQVLNGKWVMNTPAFIYDPETESLIFKTDGGN